MIYTPTRSELATIAKRLNLPTFPPKMFLSALIDVYTDFCDVEYEDILRDIDAGYLTFKQLIHGYLYYNDGDYETCVAIN